MAATLALSVVMLIYVYFFAKIAINYDIQRTVTEAAAAKSKYVSLKKGKLTVKDGFDEHEGNITALVINKKGEALYGDYPRGAPEFTELYLLHAQSVRWGGELWYVRDRFRGRLIDPESGKKRKIYIRTIVNKKDVSSEYESMAVFAYCSILLLCGAILVIAVFFCRRIKRSMDAMCRSAENIGKDFNISKRITYEGNIYEIDVLNEANNRMLDRMEHILKQQEQFNSDVAHELRTPASVTLAQCEYAQKHLDNQEEVDNAFQVIYRQSGKINEIITQLLYLSRLEQGRAILHLEEIDLQEVAESVIEDEADSLEDMVEIRKNLAPAETMGDISLIMIALKNLLGNAIKYAQGKPVEVATGRQGARVFLAVRDHGRGIAAEELDNIFERFYKEDKARNSEGFGLGLSIARKIMELCQGEVTAESKVGEGSVFTLWFQPLAKNSQNESEKITDNNIKGF